MKKNIKSCASRGNTRWDFHLATLLRTKDYPMPETEYKFCPTRRWKFDFAYPQDKIAIEIEGGLWIQGRHNRAPGMIKDMEKYNCATVMGWKVLRYTPQNLDDVIGDLQKLKGGEK